MSYIWLIVNANRRWSAKLNSVLVSLNVPPSFLSSWSWPFFTLSPLCALVIIDVLSSNREYPSFRSFYSLSFVWFVLVNAENILIRLNTRSLLLVRFSLFKCGPSSSFFGWPIHQSRANDRNFSSLPYSLPSFAILCHIPSFSFDLCHLSFVLLLNLLLRRSIFLLEDAKQIANHPSISPRNSFPFFTPRWSLTEYNLLF